MTLRIVGIVASLGAAALAFSAGETFAAGVKGAAAAPFVRPGVPITPRPPLLSHRRGFVGGYYPGSGFYYPGASYSEPPVESAPLSNDINYTYTYKQDVPWDWAHRFPPAVTPGDRPYVPNCSSELVIVPGSGGDQTVNVIRCY
jgi:hypothetical protein